MKLSKALQVQIYLSILVQWEFRGNWPNHIFIWKFIFQWLPCELEGKLWTLNPRTWNLPYLLSLEPELQNSEVSFSVSDSKSAKGPFSNRKSNPQLSTWSQLVQLFRPKRESLGIIYHFNRLYQPRRWDCLELKYISFWFPTP